MVSPHVCTYVYIYIYIYIYTHVLDMITPTASAIGLE